MQYMTDNFIISHTGKCYKFWKGIITFCQIISSYFYCVYAAYRHNVYDSITGNMFEVLFLMDMFVHCVLDFYPLPTSIHPNRRLGDILKRYLHSNEFIWDLIPLVPLQLI